MSDPFKVFLVAGEPSGDRIGAALAAELHQRSELVLEGVGGPALAQAGLKSLFPMRDLSVMGPSDIIRRLPLLLWRLRQVVTAVRRSPPDILVLIDAQEFSVRVARAIRRSHPDLPIVLYVAPTVWAWRPERATRIASTYSEVLAVLPFEPAVMTRLGGPPTSYVGHPAVDVFGGGPAPEKDSSLVALMPGSRGSELRYHLPRLFAAAAMMRREDRGLRFVLLTLPEWAEWIDKAVKTAGSEIAIASERPEVETIMRSAGIGMAAFGTATLELAAAGTPMITFFDARPVPPRIAARLAGRRLALPNIILDDDVVPELVFRAPEPERLAAAGLSLHRDAGMREAQCREFARMRELMQRGLPEAPKLNAAERVLGLAGRS